MDATREAPAVGGRSTAAPADAPAKSGPNPAVRRVMLVVGVVVLLVALFYGVKFLAYASAHETTDDAMIDADEVQITSKISERVDKILVDTNQPVKRGQKLVALDSVDEADRVTQAQAAVSAQQAQARAAQETVSLTRDTQNAQNLENKGSIAAAQAQITSAAANSASADQQIDAAQAAVDAANSQVNAAKSAIAGALENLRKTQADLNRTSSLVKTGDVAAAQLDAAKAEYEAARSNYAEVQANVATAQANASQAQQKLDSQRFTASSTQATIGVQRAQLTTAQGRFDESNAPSRVAAQQATADATNAQVKSLEAQLATAQHNLSYTNIVSPINGYVGQKNVEVGQTVAPGEALITLIPSTGVYVTANFKETQIGHMKVGQEVDISIDAYKGIDFVGHVDNLSPASQNKFSLVSPVNATGNFVKVTQRLPVRILVDKVENGNLADFALRPGMSVEASVKVK